MSKSGSRSFPVTVTHLRSRCQICHRTVACRPGKIKELLTEHSDHYRRAHPEMLGIPFR